VGQPRRWSLKVRHYEIDGYGHVNHASYVHYLETARIEALDAVGLSLGEMRRHGILAVAAELSVKYHSPAGPDETLEIVTHVREMRGARTLWVQEIREVTSGRLCAGSADRRQRTRPGTTRTFTRTSVHVSLTRLFACSGRPESDGHADAVRLKPRPDRRLGVQ